MIVGFHIRLEMTDAQPTQQWHHRLKKAKKKRHADNPA